MELTVNKFIDRYISFVQLELLEVKSVKLIERMCDNFITELYNSFVKASTFWVDNGVYPHYADCLFTEKNMQRVNDIYNKKNLGYNYFRTIVVSPNNAFHDYPNGFTDQVPNEYNGKIIMSERAPSTRQGRIYREKEEAWLEENYDLNTLEGIMSIPEEKNLPKWPGCGWGDVTGDIDYYLHFKAGQYEEEGKIDLALACLRKANAIEAVKRVGYDKDRYYWLVRVLARNGMVEEAYKEKKKIDDFFGSYDSDAIVGTIKALKERGRENEAEELRERALNKAKEKYEHYENLIPYEIQRGIDKRDYSWISENLPSICPKSLVGYRRMKKLKSKKYCKIVEEAKEKNYIIDL